MKGPKILLLLAACLLATPSPGAIYSYIDESGRLFLTDSPPNNKYQIVVTSRKDRVGPDNSGNNGTMQVVSEIVPQKVLLPNDETFSSMINQAARQHGVDPYLIKAVIKVESDFDPNIVSSKNACGLMQLIPGTAKLVGCRNIFDPQDNILGGTKYLRQMLERFNGNLDFALAGYNAGPGRVEQYRGVPPIRETRNYVAKVNHYYRAFRNGTVAPAKFATTRVTKTIPVAPSALSQKLNAAYNIFLANDTEGAIRAYQDILNIYPKNTQALYNLACLLDMERRYDEAVEIYQTALKQDPYLDKAIYNMAIIFERLGQHNDAIKAWRKFMQAAKDEEKITMAERYVKELEEYAALNP